MLNRILKLISVTLLLGGVSAYAESSATPCPPGEYLHCSYTTYTDPASSPASKRIEMKETIYAPDGTRLSKKIITQCTINAIHYVADAGVGTRNYTWSIYNTLYGTYDVIKEYVVTFTADENNNIVAMPKDVAVDLSIYEHTPGYESCYGI